MTTNKSKKISDKIKNLELMKNRPNANLEAIDKKIKKLRALLNNTIL